MVLRGKIITLAIAVIFTATAYFYFVPNAQKTAEPLTDTFSNLPVGSNLKIDYVAQNYARSENIDILSNEPVSISPEAINNNLYAVHFRLGETDKRITDITFEINKENGHIRAVVAGRPPRDQISLSLGNATLLSSTPTDWAGRFVFNEKNSKRVINKNICLNIFNSNDKSPISICHFIETAEVTS